MDELKGLERGEPNISVVSTANYFAPNLLAKFCQRYNGITVSLNVSNREIVLKQLSDNVIEYPIWDSPRKVWISLPNLSWKTRSW